MKEIEVIYKPLKKIILHSVVRRTLDEMLKTSTLGMPLGMPGDTLYWAEGIIFDHVIEMSTDFLLQEYVERGVEHYLVIVWSELAEYKDCIEANGIKVPVVNVSNVDSFVAIVRWIKRTYLTGDDNV